MPLDLSLLAPALAEKVPILVANCATQGVIIVPYMGLRTAQQQAALWRQGRTTDAINAQIGDLYAEDCYFLGSILEKAGPQEGPIVTDALPGLSEHNYGTAIDVYVEDPETGQPLWASPGYAVYRSEAKKLGLFPAFFDLTKDPGHSQLRPTGCTYPAIQIVDAQMKEKFGGSVA